MITQACKESWFITKEWYSVWFHCLESFPTPLPCILPTQCFACWSTHCLACCRISSALHFANPVLCMLVNPLPCMLPNFLRLAFCQPSALHVGQPTALHVAEFPLPCILPTQCLACWSTHCLACCQTSSGLHFANPVLCMLVNPLPLPCIFLNFLSKWALTYFSKNRNWTDWHGLQVLPFNEIWFPKLCRTCL